MRAQALAVVGLVAAGVVVRAEEAAVVLFAGQFHPAGIAEVHGRGVAVVAQLQHAGGVPGVGHDAVAGAPGPVIAPAQPRLADVQAHAPPERLAGVVRLPGDGPHEDRPRLPGHAVRRVFALGLAVHEQPQQARFVDDAQDVRAALAPGHERRTLGVGDDSLGAQLPPDAQAHAAAVFARAAHQHLGLELRRGPLRVADGPQAEAHGRFDARPVPHQQAVPGEPGVPGPGMQAVHGEVRAAQLVQGAQPGLGAGVRAHVAVGHQQPARTRPAQGRPVADERRGPGIAPGVAAVLADAEIHGLAHEGVFAHEGEQARRAVLALARQADGRGLAEHQALLAGDDRIELPGAAAVARDVGHLLAGGLANLRLGLRGAVKVAGGKQRLGRELQHAVDEPVAQARARLLGPVRAVVQAPVDLRPGVVGDHEQPAVEARHARAVGVHGVEQAWPGPGAALVAAGPQQQPAARAHVAVELVVGAQQRAVVRQADVGEAQVMAGPAVDDHMPVPCAVEARHTRPPGVGRS